MMSAPTEQDFSAITAAFTAVCPEDVERLIAGGRSAVVFFGRESCSYCRRFLPKLARAVRQTGAAVHFADSRDKAAWAELRATYANRTVPALLRLPEGEAVCDSSLSEERIAAFLTAQAA